MTSGHKRPGPSYLRVRRLFGAAFESKEDTVVKHLLRALALALPLLAAIAAAVALSVGTAHAAPTDLFISEYVEGSSSNKALELYNGTGAAVTLTGHYSVQLYANGSATVTATIPLTGTVAGGDVFVLARSAAVAAILAQADQTTTNFLCKSQIKTVSHSEPRLSLALFGGLREPGDPRSADMKR